MSDIHQNCSHRWLNPKAKVYESPIQGLGVIAAAPIAAGEVVGVLGGSIVHRDNIAAYRKDMGQVGIQINDDFFIVPTSREELELKGVFNHSCAPNIGFSDSITFVAMRDIHEGEELVFDYAFCETCFYGFQCNCGTSACRGSITQEDWKTPDLQAQYAQYFSPYLKEKIARHAGLRPPYL